MPSPNITILSRRARHRGLRPARDQVQVQAQSHPENCSGTFILQSNRDNDVSLNIDSVYLSVNQK